MWIDKSYGFVRVAAGRPEVAVANPSVNRERMIAIANEAVKNNVQVIVFPELGITGYTCGDLFHQEELLRSAEYEAYDYIEQMANTEIISIFGMPLKVGDQLFNVAVVCQKGKVLAIVPKKFIPNYKEFYEGRYFSSATKLTVSEIDFYNRNVPIGTDIIVDTGIDNFSIGVEICEDLWMPIPPSSHLAVQGATVILNPSASNELIGKAQYRKGLVKGQSARCNCAYVYVSCGDGESTSDVVWSNHAIIAENGEILVDDRSFANYDKLFIADIDVEKLSRERRMSGSFSEAVADEKCKYRRVKTEISEIEFSMDNKPRINVNPNPFVPGDISVRDEHCRDAIELQVKGLVRRLRSLDSVIKYQVVIGISGGLDSTLALWVTLQAFDVLGWDRCGIKAIAMPGFGTTDRTKNNAFDLCESLGVTLKEISIKELTLQLLRDVGHEPCMNCLTCENAQARARTLILMTMGFVIGTGDLSESVLGYCTYNGDHMSMYNPNAGVPKTLVKFLVEWVANNRFTGHVSKILLDICDTPISPELLPGQKTEVAIGKYDLNDFFIFQMFRYGFDPKKVFFLARLAYGDLYGFEELKEKLVEFYRRTFAAQFKRNAVPDGPKIGSVALSPRGDWRAPSDSKGELWIQEAKEILP